MPTRVHTTCAWFELTFQCPQPMATVNEYREARYEEQLEPAIKEYTKNSFKGQRLVLA